MSKVVISVDKVNKSFLIGSQQVEILKEITFNVNEGDFLVIFGPSGCGKSTLLHSLLGLEPPTSGKIDFLGTNLFTLPTEDDRADFRKQNIGMVYQQPNWIKSLTVVENVIFPLLLGGVSKETAQPRAEAMLSVVGMGEWAGYIPTELSSGQQQRVALARALIIDPRVIIADEPTGNLDFESGQNLMELLTRLNREGKTVIMVTHDLDYLKFAKTAIRMLDGRIVGSYSNHPGDKEELNAQIRSKRGDVKDILAGFKKEGEKDGNPE